MWYERSFDVCTMEAFACRDGLKLAAESGYQRVLLEIDCLELIQLWKEEEEQRSIAGSVLKEIEVLSLAIQEFSFSYDSRSCNKVAHCLARQVMNAHGLERWFVTPARDIDLMFKEASTG